MKKFIYALLFLCLLCPLPSRAEGPGNEVSIGTGSPTGVYYQLANAILKVVKRQVEEDTLSVKPLPSEGSVSNIENVLSGRFDFGIVQSDKLYQAVRGEGKWSEKGPQTQLRAVMALHLESITLLATEQSQIRTLADLAGKEVNIGNPGSGTRENVESLLKFVGLWHQVKRFENDPIDAVDDLVAGKFDAAFLTVGHPNLAVREATSLSRVRIIPIEDPRLASIVESRPFLSLTRIPVGFYPKLLEQQSDDVPTLALRAILVTRADQPDERVRALTKAVLAEQSYFRQLHPSLAQVTSQRMLADLTAPLHHGAESAYREAGLIK